MNRIAMNHRKKVTIWMAGALAISASLASGTAAVQAEPAPDTNDVADLVDGFVTFQRIRNIGTDMCLQPMNGSTADSLIVQMPCDGSPTQNWAFIPTVGSSTLIVNELSHSCMYFDGPIQAGTPIVQTLCDGTSNTWWTPVPVPGVAQLRSRVGRRNSGLCMDVTAGRREPGLVMDVMPCNNVTRQLWQFGN